MPPHCRSFVVVDAFVSARLRPRKMNGNVTPNRVFYPFGDDLPLKAQSSAGLCNARRS